MSTLPRSVEDAVRRDVERDVRTTAAAWGDPPIVLRCGVGLPGDYRPDAEVVEVDGVAWFPSEGEGGTFYSTVGREAVVEVAVPDDYDAAPVLVALADVVAVGVPEP